MLGDAGEEGGPVEARAGVGLAARRHFAVRRDVAQRQARAQNVNQFTQAPVLRRLERARRYNQLARGDGWGGAPPEVGGK